MHFPSDGTSLQGDAEDEVTPDSGAPRAALGTFQVTSQHQR